MAMTLHQRLEEQMEIVFSRAHAIEGALEECNEVATEEVLLEVEGKAREILAAAAEYRRLNRG